MNQSSYQDLSAQIDAIKSFVTERDIKLITAVQVPNPNRRVVDIGNTWDPMFVVIDYLKS